MANDTREEPSHEKSLEDLGFVQVDKHASLTVRAINTQRNQRRLLRKQKYRPWFTASSVITIATDELGQTWIGPPNTDLAHLGYEDKSAEALSDMNTFGLQRSRH
jgi:hypothetical protein